MCNPAFTFGLSHAVGRVLTLTASPVAPGRKGWAARPQQVWLAAGSRRLWAEAAP